MPPGYGQPQYGSAMGPPMGSGFGQPGYGVPNMNSGFNDPDANKVLALINECATTGSYMSGGNVVEAARKVALSFKSKSSALSVGKGDYQENPSRKFDIVYLSGPVEVPYGGTKYSIHLKLILPPTFPEHCPIVSVVNIDPSMFAVNKEYQPGILPDETFAIPTFNGSQWKQHLNFDAVMTELISKLGSQFPLFKTKSVVKPQAPKFYPPLIGGYGGNSQNGFNPPPPGYGGMPSQFPVFPNPNQQYQQPPQQQRPPAPATPTGPTPVALRFMSSQVEALAMAVQAEIQTDIKQFSTLSAIRKENKSLYDRSALHNDNLLKLDQANNQRIKNLTAFKDKSQQINMEELLKNGQLVVPQDKRSEEILDTLAQLRSIAEVDHILQDQFKNGDLKVSFEDVYSSVEKLAKQEFTLKSKLQQLTK